MSSDASLNELTEAIRRFNEARDWGQFHTPKNLASGLVIEAAELLEVLQWDEPTLAEHIPRVKRERLAEEIGDVLIHLLNLADKLELDVVQCGFQKLRRNDAKYPAARVRGSARKYDEYDA